MSIKKTHKGSQGFYIPVQDPDYKPSINLESAEIMKWRAKLPMADIGACAKKVYGFLTELNNTMTPANNRLEILELCRPPVQLICQGLKRHYLNQSVELSKQKIVISQLAQALQLEMILGYKVVVEEMHTKISDSEVKKTVGLSIHRIMHLYTCIFLRNYQLYSSHPHHMWREIHFFYKYAEKNKLLNIDLGDRASLNPTEHSLLECYTHVLLLAATNPYQWRQTEQETINNALAFWTPFAKIRPYDESDQVKPGIYLFDYEKDSPPFPIQLKKIPITKSLMVLDLTKEVGHLQELINDLKGNELKTRMEHSGDPEYEVNLITLRRLKEDWGKLIQREYQRFQIKGSVNIAFGLSSTHFYISGEKEFNPKESIETSLGEDLDSVLPTLDESSEILPTVDDGSEEDSLLSGFGSDLEDELKEDTTNQKYPLRRCKLVNINPAGCCLSWLDDSYPPIQPGEIIGFQLHLGDNNNKNLPWNVGVIRWIKYQTGEPLHMGVKLLSANAAVAGAQLVQNDKPMGVLLRCLLLPEVADGDQPASIITPILPFKENREILIAGSDQPKVNARLEQQLEASSNYRLFKLDLSRVNVVATGPTSLLEEFESELSDELGDTQETSDFQNKIDDEFDSIWGDL